MKESPIFVKTYEMMVRPQIKRTYLLRWPIRPH